MAGGKPALPWTKAMQDMLAKGPQTEGALLARALPLVPAEYALRRNEQQRLAQAKRRARKGGNPDTTRQRGNIKREDAATAVSFQIVRDSLRQMLKNGTAQRNGDGLVRLSPPKLGHNNIKPHTRAMYKHLLEYGPTRRDSLYYEVSPLITDAQAARRQATIQRAKIKAGKSPGISLETARRSVFEESLRMGRENGKLVVDPNGVVRLTRDDYVL